MKAWFREPMNGLTHFVGIPMAGWLLFLLLTRTSQPLTQTHTITFWVFGLSMMMLYTASTLYHWLKVSEKAIQVLRKIDHMMIFVFIAASYTPICLIILKGWVGWSVFATVWGIAVLGFVFKMFWLGAPRALYTAIYLLMGWIILVAIFPLTKVFSIGGIAWLGIGGLFYSAGALIYAMKKPDPWPDFFGFHEIFHIFILLGSISHFWMMYNYV